ncbi:hypothetical protein BDK51DRAFT_16879 [Blyttiomyces helicus]|uniref:CBS domain-containing protein n=1 Tax=Blyttiomyces helicus TaxID=388810 RepID=A0A4P9WCC0_9FUNG|nr:hypothetical protein BDK51DRAFT_16879 [Blyttiomyces helicus]|eukprot:RKO87996.1 hypothetical protein BDK51DRAFT_16879 [Blyttiomyces helicus]
MRDGTTTAWRAYGPPVCSNSLLSSPSPQADQDPVCSFLDDTSVAHLLRLSRSGPVHPVCLDSELTVKEGCMALADHKISSAPVYDRSSGSFIGMLDYGDLVTYVLAVLHKVHFDEVFTPDSDWEITDIVKRALPDKDGVPIKLLSNISHKDPLVSFLGTTSGLEAVRAFSRSKLHRIVVLEEQEAGKPKTFIGVLSMSTVVAYVASHFGKLSGKMVPKPLWPKGEKTLEQLGLVSPEKELIYITVDDTVLTALSKMHEHKISSVAIVNRGGEADELYGSISMADIKEIFAVQGGWKSLYKEAFKFLCALRSQQGLDANGDDRVPSFTVSPTSTLLHAIEKIAATRAHRVWVVDARKAPIGVVSLSDVMNVIAKE